MASVRDFDWHKKILRFPCGKITARLPATRTIVAALTLALVARPLTAPNAAAEQAAMTLAREMPVLAAARIIDIALGIVGARYHFNAPTEKGIVTPEIRGSLLYDFAGDEAQSTSTFTGGGASFQVAGADVAELGGSLGAGLSYTTHDGRVTLGADYDVELKEDFIGHAGRIEFRLHF